MTSATFVRLCFVVLLIPTYLSTKSLAVLPNLFMHTMHLLFGRHGCDHFVARTDAHRRHEDSIAKRQLSGSFRFNPDEIAAAPASEIKFDANWFPHTERFTVLNANASVVHEKPAFSSDGRKRKKILLLHGNPSWSFMWRDVIPALCDRGFEVFALDWLGHGFSDKIRVPSLITFELHQRTLRDCIHRFGLEDAVVVAHDWGGCIASVTLGELDSNAVVKNDGEVSTTLDTRWSGRIFFLNSFFPPRPADIDWNGYALWLLWFLTTGILDGYVPEWAVMGYMAPTISASVARAYGVPFSHAQDKQGKASVTRFAHLVPGFPDVFYFTIRQWWVWRFMEGLAGPEHFTNFNAQSRLAAVDSASRRSWRTAGKKGWVVEVLFGRQDPLLPRMKPVIETWVDHNALVKVQNDGWIDDAGHYPIEEKPGIVTEEICRFADLQSDVRDV